MTYRIHEAKPLFGQDTFKGLAVADTEETAKSFVDYLERKKNQAAEYTNLNFDGKELPNEIVLDWGGVIGMAWERCCIESEGVKYKFYPHHLTNLMVALNNALNSNDGLPFVYVNLRYWDAVIGVVEAFRLRSALRESYDEIKAVGDGYIEQHANAVTTLQQAGVIAKKKEVSDA